MPSLTDPFRLTFEDDIDLSGGNLLGRWRHSVAETSNLVLQLYYDRTHRKEMIFKETRDTFDIDFQHQFHWGKQNELLWGLGYRLTQDDTTGSFTASLTPDRRSDHLFSAFFQDELTLVPERLRLILGTKLEHNDYTGFEIQPNLRLIWTSDARSSLWASVARAVRTPSRAEADGRSNIETFAPGALFPFSPVAVAAGVGSDEAAAEELIAYELGYRIRPLDRLSLDLALFFNDYDHLSNLTAGRLALERAPAPPPSRDSFFRQQFARG